MKELYATSPGTFVDLPDKNAMRFKSALFHLSDYFCDARLAKELYDNAAARYQAECDFAMNNHSSPFTDAYFRSRRERKMYAQEFVFALDYFVKELDAMANESNAPELALKQVLNDFNAQVPGIVKVRDALHHVADRGRGIGRRNKRIKAKAINKYNIEGGGNFVGVNLAGSTVFCTGDTGHAVEVDITEATLEKMIATLQRVIDSVPWHKGCPERHPGRNC